MSDPVHNGWTIATYAAHNEALRAAEKRFDDERDRRYKEVGEEKEKAKADLESEKEKAMGLARDIQTYKDVKANELREQLGKERLDYASKLDLKASVEKIEETFKPVISYIQLQQGGSKGMRDMWGWILAAAMAGAALFNIFGPNAR